MTKSQKDGDCALNTLEHAHVSLRLTYREIAQVIGADESSVHRWRRGESVPSLVFVRQIRQLGRCLDQLEGLFASWEEARSWMKSHSEQLSGERPIDVLQEGEVDRVIGALYLMSHTSTT